MSAWGGRTPPSARRSPPPPAPVRSKRCERTQSWWRSHRRSWPRPRRAWIDVFDALGRQFYWADVVMVTARDLEGRARRRDHLRPADRGQAPFRSARGLRPRARVDDARRRPSSPCGRSSRRTAGSRARRTECASVSIASFGTRLGGQAHMHVAQVEPVRLRAHLEHRARLDRLGHHRLDVERVRPPAGRSAAPSGGRGCGRAGSRAPRTHVWSGRRPTGDGRRARSRRRHRAGRAARRSSRASRRARMSTSAPASRVKPGRERLGQRADALDLRMQPAGVEAHPEPDRGRVVGDIQVLVAAAARGGRPSLERRLAVAPVGVGVQVAADVPQRQRGPAAVPPAPLRARRGPRAAGWDERAGQGARRLRASSSELQTSPDSTTSMPYSLTLRPARTAASRSATLWAFDPVRC